MIWFFEVYYSFVQSPIVPSVNATCFTLSKYNTWANNIDPNSAAAAASD